MTVDRGKVIRLQAMKAHCGCGCGRKGPYILSYSTRKSWVASPTLDHLYPPGKPGSHSTGVCIYKVNVKEQLERGCMQSFDGNNSTHLYFVVGK